MSNKREIKRKETQVGHDRQLEQTLTFEERILPSPEELQKYKDVDPKILEQILEQTKLEQKHRHELDNQKITIIGKAESRAERMNKWGMIFAFLALLAIIGVCAYALFLDKVWFSGILGGTVIISIISLFIQAGKNNQG